MGIRVKDIMTRDVVTVSRDATLREIAGLLVKNSVSSVPVCDDTGQVVGIISERDLLVLLAKRLPSAATGGSRRLPRAMILSLNSRR